MFRAQTIMRGELAHQALTDYPSLKNRPRASRTTCEKSGRRAEQKCPKQFLALLYTHLCTLFMDPYETTISMNTNINTKQGTYMFLKLNIA